MFFWGSDSGLWQLLQERLSFGHTRFELTVSTPEREDFAAYILVRQVRDLCLAGTQYLRTLVPRTIPLMVFGIRVHKYWVLGPSGYVSVVQGP